MTAFIVASIVVGLFLMFLIACAIAHAGNQLERIASTKADAVRFSDADARHTQPMDITAGARRGFFH